MQAAWELSALIFLSAFREEELLALAVKAKAVVTSSATV